MNTKLNAITLGIFLTLGVPAHAGLEEKLASTNPQTREKALHKLEALNAQDKIALFDVLVAKRNELVHVSPTDSQDAWESLNRAIVISGRDIIIDPADKSYRVYSGVCQTLASMGDATPPAIPALIKLLRYQGHPDTSALTIQDEGLAPETVYISAKRALIQIGKPAVPHLIAELEREYPDLAKGAPDLSLDHLAGSHARMEPLWILGEIQTDEAQVFSKRFIAALTKKNSALAARKNQLERQQAQLDADKLSAIRKAAMSGDARAQNDLGVMYLLGNGVTKDRTEAFKWLSKSYKQHADADTEANLYAVLRDEVRSELLAEDVKWGRQPLSFMMPLPSVLGKLYAKERPLWVFVDAGWEFSSAYAKRAYTAKLLQIVRRYPLKVDAITIRRWDTENNVREVTYTEAPWDKVIFGDTLKTLTAEGIAPRLPTGIVPDEPQQGPLEAAPSRR